MADTCPDTYPRYALKFAMESFAETRTMRIRSPVAVDSASDSWRFYNPVSITFGEACRGQLPGRLAEFPQLLVVCTHDGRQRLQVDPLLGSWSRSPELHWMDQVSMNPGLHELQSHLDELKGRSFDAIVALGGGSSLDTAKVLAVGLSPESSGQPLSELLVTPGRIACRKRIPLIALPTTAGTGSEVTPFATVWDHVQRKKYSLAGADVFPTEAIVDPQLTHGLPPEITMATGLDAINQASESLWNRHATAITRNFATRSLRVGIPALVRLVTHGEDASARSQLAEASLLAGLAISQTRTALCHSMSYPITAHFGVAHGLACAFTMSAVLRQSLNQDDGRFATLATDLLGPEASTSDLLQLYEELTDRMQVRQRVVETIKDESALTDLIAEMMTPGRADNCLFSTDQRTLADILQQSWHGFASSDARNFLDTNLHQK